MTVPMPGGGRSALLWAVLLLAMVAETGALIESGATILSKPQPWQHLSRFSFSGGEQGTISGTITRIARNENHRGSHAGVYLYCEFELEKIRSLREDLNLKVGSLEECDELTSPGIWLTHSDLTPNSNGEAEFSLTVPIAPKERVCIVALADCSLARTKLNEGAHKDPHLLHAFTSKQGFADMALHFVTNNQGVMPPIAGLGIIGFIPGIVSGMLSTQHSESVLNLASRFMSQKFKDSMGWSPHGYWLHFENGGSHLPAEEAWLPAMYFVLTIALLCYVPIYRGMIRQHQLVGKSRDHITLWVTLLLACQIFHVASEEIHLLSIQFTGEPIKTLDWLSHMCMWVAQFGVAGLLVMLSWGWTLTPRHLKIDFMRSKSLCGIGPAGTLAILGSIEGLLALNAKVFKHAGFGLHHDFESWPGMLVVVFRLLVLVLLRVGISQQIAESVEASKQSGAQDESQLREFLRKLGFYGALFMLALPLSVACAGLVAPAWRHRVISMMAAATQSIAIVSITRLLYGRSLYFKLAGAALQDSGAAAMWHVA